MIGRASAYAALGLEPDADPAAVEKAYKRLIKQHHPDREGGDSGRAAEINRAYRELRTARPVKDPLEFHEDFSVRRRGRKRWVAAGLAVVALGSILLVTGSATTLMQSLWPAAGPHLPLGHVAAVAAIADPMDKPLHLAAINGAMRDASDLARSSDEMALASASRDCHHGLRSDPSLTQLDRCAAFDDTVVQLQDRDPLHDRGPFSELAVTGRQWSAASLLSDDYLAIDGRLDRIRLHVELALASKADSAGVSPTDGTSAASAATRPDRRRWKSPRQRSRAASRPVRRSHSTATI